MSVAIEEEGALIFSAVKIQQGYRDNADIVRMCKNRIRVPEVWWGDYLASLGAVRIAELELLALGKEVGWDTLERYAESWFDYSEAKMVEAIRRLKSGRRSGHASSHHRRRSHRQPRLSALRPDSHRVAPTSAAIVGVYNGILDHVPANAGSFRRVTGKVRENCAVGLPRHPFSCSVATTNLADRTSNPVQRALAEIAPGFGQPRPAPSSRWAW